MPLSKGIAPCEDVKNFLILPIAKIIGNGTTHSKNGRTHLEDPTMEWKITPWNKMPCIKNE